jgi:uncharacterized RDD family membrane protein YckC
MFGKIFNSPFPLWRRLAVLPYDGLLVFTILIVASSILLPFKKSEFEKLIESGVHLLVYNNAAGLTQNYLKTAYFLVVLFIFFGWFWTHGGQTLGMRAWKLRLVNNDGTTINWLQAALRFILSLPFWTYLGILSFKSFFIGKDIAIINSLFSLPGWLLYLVAAIWFILDYLPSNWRDRLSGTRMIMANS